MSAGRRVWRGVAGGLLAGLLSALLVSPAGAREVSGFSVTQDVPQVTKNYPGQPEPRPSIKFADWDYAECLEATYCDLIPITVKPGKPNGHRTAFRIEWSSMAEYEARLFTGDGKTWLGSLTPTNPKKKGAKARQISVVDIETGLYKVGVMCFADPCNVGGYVASGRIDYEKGYTPPEQTKSATPSTRPTRAQQTSSPSRSPAPPRATTTGPSMAPPDPVVTPGKDGPVRAHALKTLPVSRQASPPKDRLGTITNIVLAILLALVLGGGGAFVALRIRRDLRV